jgi:hypothetical protein
MGAFDPIAISSKGDLSLVTSLLKNKSTSQSTKTPISSQLWESSVDSMTARTTKQ